MTKQDVTLNENIFQIDNKLINRSERLQPNVNEGNYLIQEVLATLQYLLAAVSVVLSSRQRAVIGSQCSTKRCAFEIVLQGKVLSTQLHVSWAKDKILWETQGILYTYMCYCSASKQHF